MALPALALLFRMRPLFVAAVLSVAALFLSAVSWLKRSPDPQPTALIEIPGPAVSSGPTTDPSQISTPALANRLIPQQRGATEAETEWLTQLSIKNDTVSLPEILRALTHPDREVREAAIETTRQVGDSNAIPVLKQASEMVDDAEEKIEYLEAMEFLAVPRLAFDKPAVPRTPEQIAAAERRRTLRRAEIEREERQSRSLGDSMSQ